MGYVALSILKYSREPRGEPGGLCDTMSMKTDNANANGARADWPLATGTGGVREGSTMKKHYATYTPTPAEMALIRKPVTETEAEAVARLKALNRLYAEVLRRGEDTTLIRNASALIRRSFATGERGYQRTIQTTEVSNHALIAAKAPHRVRAAEVIRERKPLVKSVRQWEVALVAAK